MNQFFWILKMKKCKWGRCNIPPNLNNIYCQFHIDYQKAKARERRKMVLDHYGAYCHCCNETIYEFLSIEHVENDGYRDRQNNRKGSGMIKWLIKNDYPQNITILCYNCNLAKGHHGFCPHTLLDN